MSKETPELQAVLDGMSLSVDQVDSFVQGVNFLLLREMKDVVALLDWVGVGQMPRLRERVLYLCAEFLSRTGQVASIDHALALGHELLEDRDA